MVTIKSYTDISQSKKLAEILPIESADMCYIQDLLAGGKYGKYKPYIGDLIPAYGQDRIKCWSLASLLGVLPDYTLQTNTDGTVFVVCDSKKPMISDAYNNPVDACYEMILKLHELDLV
jgi:hypothetical protein